MWTIKTPRLSPRRAAFPGFLQLLQLLSSPWISVWFTGRLEGSRVSPGVQEASSCPSLIHTLIIISCTQNTIFGSSASALLRKEELIKILVFIVLATLLFGVEGKLEALQPTREMGDMQVLHIAGYNSCKCPSPFIHFRARHSPLRENPTPATGPHPHLRALPAASGNYTAPTSPTH